MIHDVDNTIETLLKQELPPELAEQVTISFATPDAEFPPGMAKLPTINFFLYDVCENLERRTSEMILLEQKSKGKLKKNFPAVLVNFSYLVTAWSAQNPTSILEEHEILGETMKVLLRFPRIPPEVLQGSLEELEPLPVALTLKPKNLQELGLFWQVLGWKPKVALNYTITLSVDFEKQQEVRQIEEHEIVINYHVPEKEQEKPK